MGRILFIPMPGRTRLLGSQGNLSKLASQPNKSRASNKNLRELYDEDLDDCDAKPIQPPQQKSYACTVEGEWAELTSGGNMSYATWRNNPQYNLDFPHNLTEATEVKITLAQSCIQNTERVLEEEPESDVNKVGFYVCRRDGIYAEPELRDKRFVTFSQEHFVCVSQFSQDSVSCEVTLPVSDLAFVLIPVSFVPGHLAKFTLTVHATHPVQLSPLDTQIASWHAASCTGEWSMSGSEGAIEEDKSNLQDNLSGFNTAGGCRHHITWRNNPQFALNVEEPAIVLISLSQESKPDLCTMGIYVANKTTERHQRKMIMNSVDIMGKTLFCCVKEIQLELSLCPSTFGYRIVPTTYAPGECNKYEINVWSTQPLTLEPVTEHWSFVVSDGEWKLPPRSLSARSLVTTAQPNPIHVSFTTDLAPRVYNEPYPNPDVAGIKQLSHDIVRESQTPLIHMPPPRLPSLLGPAPDIIPQPATSTPFGYYADAQGVFRLKFQASTTDLSVVIALLHIAGPELKNQGFHVLRVDAEDEVKGDTVNASHVVTTEFAKKWEISRKIMGLSSDVTLLIIPAFLSDESVDSGSGCKFRVGVFGTVSPGQMQLSPLVGPLLILPKKKIEEDIFSALSETEDETESEIDEEPVGEIPQTPGWPSWAVWAGVVSGMGLVSYSLWRIWKLKQRRGR